MKKIFDENWIVIKQNLYLLFYLWIYIILMHLFADDIAIMYYNKGIHQIQYKEIIFWFFIISWCIYCWKSIYKFISRLYKDTRIDFLETIFFTWLFLFLDCKIEVIIWFIVTLWISLFLLEKLHKNGKQPDFLKSLLLSDKPIEKIEEDELGFTEKVLEFIDIIYNNWVPGQFVYWLEAPWWHGKSTFLWIFKDIVINKNFNEWTKKNKFVKIKELKEKTKNIKIFEFNPWHFNNDADLLEKFFEEFKLFLTENYFLPELSSTIDQLTEKLDWVSHKVTWVKFFQNKYTLEHTKQSIRDSLNRIDDKILIIIDDLDRIPSQKLKTIFSLIDLVKSFPKVNFIVCYDSCNFNHIEDTLKDTVTVTEWNLASVSSEKVNNNNLVEYISKIINVKYNIYIKFETIKKYLLELINTRFINGENNFQQKLEEELDILFTWENFEIFWPYLFNIRAIKRLINHLLCKYYWDERYLQDLLKQVDKEISDNNDFSISKKLVVEILELYHSDLYRDILFEANWDIDNDIFYSSENNKYCLWQGFKDEIAENKRFKNYINNLNQKEREIILYLFPTIPNNGIKKDILKNYWLRDKKQFQLYFNHNKKELLLSHKINVDLGENRQKVYLYSSNTTELVTIFQNLINSLWQEYLDIFIGRINNVISTQNNSKEIAKNLFNFYISDNFKKLNSWKILNSYDWIRLLDEWVWKHNSYKNCKYIWEFLYWKNIIENLIKSWEPANLVLTIRIMNSLYDGDFYNLSRWMIDEFELNKNKNYYIAKISRIIFTNFRETYINKINIFKSAWFQRHILYYTSIFIGRFYDNTENLNDISKVPEWINQNLAKLLECEYYKEFQNYIFDFCLQWEGKEEIFFDHFSVYIREPDSHYNRGNPAFAFIYDGKESNYILHPEKTRKFVKNNFGSLKQYITQNKDKTFTIEDKETKTLWEIGMIILNYFSQEPKKED